VGLANGFGLKRSISVTIGIASVPKGPGERPKKVDQFSSPDVAGVEMSINLDESEKELVLDLSPLLGETASEELAPAKDGLFLTKEGHQFY
jgi:hypothetical protein